MTLDKNTHTEIKCSQKGLEFEINEVKFFVPDIVLVGVGRSQTYQHSCLNCSGHFFFTDSIVNYTNLFCENCDPDLNKIADRNISDSNYIGNIIGWKQVVESDCIGRKTKNYKKVYVRDKYTCQYCGYNIANATKFLPLHIDHIKPHSASGGNSVKNLCVACSECNCIANNKWFFNFEEKKQFILNRRKEKYL